MLPPPEYSPAPAPPKATELETKDELRIVGDPLVTLMPAPCPEAKFEVMMSWESDGLPLLIQMPAPRSWLEAGLPSAWPPLIVKPSSTAEEEMELSVVTTWKLLSVVTPAVPTSPESVTTLASGSRCERIVSVPTKPP